MEKELKEKIESKLENEFDWKEIEEGLNTIILLESEKEEYILKVKTNEELDEERFKAEPTIYEMIDRKTDIPSPEIIWEGIEGDSPNFYLMERIEGRTLEVRKEDLNAEELESFLRQFGEILGEIHQNIELDYRGLLAYNKGELGTLGEEESWKGVLKSWINSMTGRINNQWKQPPEINKEKILEELKAITGPEPVLMHLDNRLENIIIRDDKINGLVDWSYSGAGDKYFDLVRAEYLIVDYDLNSWNKEVQEKFREALLEGYRSNADFDQNVYRKQRPLYRKMTVLWLIAGFPNWGSEFDQESYEWMEQNLRDRLRKEQS